MKKKKDLNEEIDGILAIYNVEEMIALLRDIYPIIDMYNVDENDDWVRDIIGEEANTVRALRTVYLLSRLAEFHTGKLANIKTNFKDLYLKMERAGNEIESVTKENPV